MYGRQNVKSKNEPEQLVASSGKLQQLLSTLATNHRMFRAKWGRGLGTDVPLQLYRSDAPD